MLVPFLRRYAGCTTELEQVWVRALDWAMISVHIVSSRGFGDTICHYIEPKLEKLYVIS